MERIYEYIKQHATPQSEALAWVEKQTHIRTNHARMLSGSAQGQLMRMLVQMTGARRILELGLIAYGKVSSGKDNRAMVNGITAEEVQRMAQTIFAKERLSKLIYI